MTVVAAMGVAGGIGWLAGRWISNQVHRIATFAREISQGRVARLPAASGPFGTLAAALNEMAESIDQRVASIAEDHTRFEAVLSGMVEGVMVLDRAGRVLLVNAAMARILSRPLADVKGHRWIEVIRHHELNELISRVLKERETSTAQILLESAGTRSQRVFAVQASIAQRQITPGDDGFRAVFVFHDVTELKRLERVRSDFVANVSHELRTPLTSIAGYLEALLDGAQDDPQQRREFLGIMKHHTDRLGALVNDLLQLSQIESGAYQWRREEVDVVSLARRSVALIAPLAQKKSLVVSCDSDAPARYVEGDAEKLIQVLLNLLDNAVKYTEKGGTVGVKVTQEGHSVVIRVSDTGVGIPEADRLRIFERFFRVDRARSRELGGTGLGLAIVKHIVEAHGGTVAVDSHLGKGSMFTVMIPI
jgi:two-component system phosphate regulon sensor histidine kinase PhoR